MITHYFFTVKALAVTSQCISTILIVIGIWTQPIGIISIIVIDIARRVYIEYIRIPVSIAERVPGTKNVVLIEYPIKLF